MLEHIIVFFVFIGYAKNLFNIESRGKLGFIHYITKLIIRCGKKIPFIKRKI
jgi:hypothetical protein